MAAGRAGRAATGQLAEEGVLPVLAVASRAEDAAGHALRRAACRRRRRRGSVSWFSCRAAGLTCGRVGSRPGDVGQHRCAGPADAPAMQPGRGIRWPAAPAQARLRAIATQQRTRPRPVRAARRRPMTPRTRPAGMVISAPPRIPQASAAVAGRLRMAGPVAGGRNGPGHRVRCAVRPGGNLARRRGQVPRPGPGTRRAGRTTARPGAPSSGGDGMRPGRSVTATAHWLRSAERQDCFNGITGCAERKFRARWRRSGEPTRRAACYRPAAARRLSARSVRSQEKSGSSRPK